MIERDFWKELGEHTPENVRKLLAQRIWSEEKVRLAEQWLQHQTSLQSSAENAASLAEARAANDLARAANSSAEEANSIARAASESAKRSANQARISNVIASASAAAAIIAIVVSIIGLVHTVRHDNAPKAEASAKAH